MPLTLVTGPANAEKAREVLERLRAVLDRDPILVVPTAADADHYRRELLTTHGVVFGARVEQFERLLEEVARRAGVTGAPLGPLARERVVVAAAGRARLDALAESARTPGFARAACRLFDELEEDRVAPDRFARALRAWAQGHTGRRRYGAELAGLYRSYRERLEDLGRRDEPLHRAAALDALREDPALWGETPVLFYGFDDLQPLQRDAIVALALTEAEVTVSLAYEPGRYAFAARGQAYADLAPHAERHVELPPRAGHYAEEAREALHHLERSLFEDPAAAPLAVPRAASGATARGSSGPGSGATARGSSGPGSAAFPRDPFDELAASLFDDVAARGVTAGDLAGVAAGDAVRFLEGGGERAELELVAAEAARLIADEGFAPEEVAVVMRRPEEAAALVEHVFAACGVPVAVAQHTTLGHTALGRGFAALVRAATPSGTAADVIAWLRTPGVVRQAHLVDRLEGDVRRTGARTAAEARALWEEWPLDALDRIAAAARRGPLALLERLQSELAALFAAPHRRAGHVLDGGEVVAAAALAAGHAALADLADVAPLLPSLHELAAVLEAVPVPVGERVVPGAVSVTDPLSLRARRVRALFACRLVEGTFPAARPPEPFLDEDERRRLNAATRALRLRVDDDAAGAERYLLYATLSRPQERLYLSWHAATDDGDPTVRSPFVDDVAGLFADAPLDRRARRDLGAVSWPGAVAPTERERLRARAHDAPRVREPVAAPLTHPDVLRGLRERRTWSASGLETWAGCPVKWFVERVLRPEEIDPDPEALVRGNLAHKVLERALRRLVEQGALTPDRLPEAREAVRAALAELAPEVRMSVELARRRALEHRLEADLLRYVEAAARSGSEFVPAHFEQRFDGLDIGDGVLVAGTVDRIDVRGGEAIVYDYKGKTATPGAKWLDEHRFQLAVYALAARRVLDLEPVGALYQPLGAPDLRPRGALLDGTDPDLVSVDRDRRSREELDALVDEAVAAALEAAREAREGLLEPRPDTCAWDGGCAYPTICRCEATS
jgi:ATP-dependent helicase/DNAse subunit B